MQRRVFFGKVNLAGLKEASASFVIPAIILTLITIGVGLFFPFFVNTILFDQYRILIGMGER